MGDDAKKRHAFEKVFHQIMNRVQLFVNLPLKTLDAKSLKREMDAIGQTDPN
jgi:arsenate reductase